MLTEIEGLYGHTLKAHNGELGRVEDFLFDDITWEVRYLVVDTGSWLSTRQVLLSPHAFGALDAENKSLEIRLTRDQVEHSPSIDAHLPVSRQHEVDYHRYYGWPAYWTHAAAPGPEGDPVAAVPTGEAVENRETPRRPEDRHLRSARAMKGHRIEATDGDTGKIAGFMVDDKNWSIRELIVDAGHRYNGKKVLIAPDKVEQIVHEESKVVVALAKSDIERTGEHRVVHDRLEKRAAPEFPTD